MCLLLLIQGSLLWDQYGQMSLWRDENNQLVDIVQTGLLQFSLVSISPALRIRFGIWLQAFYLFNLFAFQETHDAGNT